MECCGVHSYKDFNKALEFKKYTNEEGDGQIIPEACCLLEDNSNRNTEQLAKLLFQPKDPNCVSVPTVTNSYMNQVILLYPTTVVDKIICMKNGFDIKMTMKSKGSFNNYVDRILPFFAPPPSSCLRSY